MWKLKSRRTGHVWIQFQAAEPEVWASHATLTTAAPNHHAVLRSPAQSWAAPRTAGRPGSAPPHWNNTGTIKLVQKQLKMTKQLLPIWNFSLDEFSLLCQHNILTVSDGFNKASCSPTGTCLIHLLAWPGIMRVGGLFWVWYVNFHVLKAATAGVLKDFWSTNVIDSHGSDSTTKESKCQ